MNIGMSGYDSELQMFTDRPPEPNMDRLRFMRWLVENGRLEHGVEGQPAGAFAFETLDSAPAAA